MAQQSAAVRAFVQTVIRHYVVAYKPNQNFAVLLYKGCCCKVQNFGARLLLDPLGSDALVEHAISLTAPHLTQREGSKASNGKSASAGSVPKGVGKPNHSSSASAGSIPKGVGGGGKPTVNVNNKPKGKGKGKDSDESHFSNLQIAEEFYAAITEKRCR